MIYENVVCPFCGCLCDDIIVTVENGQITKTKNACAISKSKFVNHHQNTLNPSIGGQEVSLEKAIDKAADILRNAHAPLIYGLSSTECED